MGGGGGEGEGSGGGGLPNRLKPGCGHHRHDALPFFGTQGTSMVPPGQVCVPVCSSACLSYYLSPPPVFVPFCPFFFFPLFPSFRLCLYPPFCFLLSAFAFCLASSSSFFFVFVYQPLFCFPGVFCSGVRMFIFSFLSLFYTPRVACEPAICENTRIILCVCYLA